MPGPHFVKQIIIKEYARRYPLNIMVETGTFKGDMMRAMRGIFKKLYTIELHEGLHAKATELFKNKPKITCIHGDSGTELPKLVAQLNEPALFWLDGHYSGEKTAKGDIDTPILKELECILTHSVKNHIILVDDARLFVGEKDYPTIDELTLYCNERRPDLVISVSDDVIRIEPKAK